MSTSVPSLSANAGIYVLDWEPECIKICVDRLYDSKGSTAGEVTVQYRPPAGTDFEHLHQARLNLTSTRERAGLAKHLGERVPEVDWGCVLEQACVKVLEKSREGEPFVMVGNLPTDGQAKHLSYPLLLAGQPNLVFGQGGTGKSTLAAMLALEVAHSNEGGILWLDSEWDQCEVNSLVRRLKAGMAVAPELDVAYRFCSQPLADDIAAIQRMVLETQAVLVIVDSVGAACGGDPMDPAAVLRYFNALRSLRVTTLSLDHTAKEARGPFGSVYKVNASRNVWEAQRGSNSDEGTMSLALHHRKTNSGPLLKPLGFQFAYKDDAIFPRKCDARVIPEALANMAVADQIEAELGHGPMTAADLAEALGKTTSHIAKTLSSHKGKFRTLGGGKWGLTAPEGLTP